MPVSITVPLAEKPKTVKDAIISFLAQEWPVSAKKLYNKVRKAGFEVSYQAVHKSLKELLGEGIVERGENDYQLNKHWIRGVKKFASQIRVTYEEKSRPPMEKLITGELNTTTFHNLFEFLSFMTDFLTRLQDFQEEHGILTEFRHLWWPLSFDAEGQKRFERLCSGYPGGGYVLCRSDTAIDRLVADLYNSFKYECRVRYGIDCAKEFDVCVVGDFVVQAFFADEMTKKLDKIYKTVKDLKSSVMGDFLKTLFFEKTKINLVVVKNPALAEQKRKRILQHFKGGKNAKPSKR